MSHNDKKANENISKQLAQMKELKAQTDKIKEVYNENVISLEKMLYMWGDMSDKIKGIPEELKKQEQLYESIEKSAKELGDKYAASKEEIIEIIDLLRQKKQIEKQLQELNDKSRRGDVITKEEIRLFSILDNKLKDIQKTIDNTGNLGEFLSEDLQDQNSEASKQLKLQEKLSDSIAKQLENYENINKELNKTEDRLKNIKKSGIVEALSSAWTIGKNIISKGVTQWQDIEQMSYDFGRQMGMTGNQLKQHNDGITKNYGEMARTLGMEVKEIYKFQTGYAEATEKSVLLSTSQITSMAALSRNTSEEAISTASKNLDVFATSADATVEYLAKGSARAALEGLNVKKYSAAFANNIKLASKYTFKEGITGIQKMTLLSQRLKFNMESIGSVMDKFSTIEGAIEVGSKLQVLGGSFAQNFGNPLAAMSDALLNGEAFTQRIIDSVSKIAKFNSKTGELDLSPIDKQRLKAAASAMGISYDELHNMATQSKKEEIVSSAVANKKLNEQQKAYLVNKAQFNKETGKWHLTKADGSVEEKDISQMTSKEIDEARGKDSYEKILSADVRSIHELLKNKANSELNHRETIKGIEEDIATKLAHLINNLPELAKWIIAAIAGSSFLGGLSNVRRMGKGLFKLGKNAKSIISSSGNSRGVRSLKAAWKAGLHGKNIGKFGNATSLSRTVNGASKLMKGASKLSTKIAAPLVVLDAGYTAYSMYSANQDYKKNVAEIKASNKYTLDEKAKLIREQEKAKSKTMNEGGVELGAMGVGAAIGTMIAPGVGTLIGAGIGGLVGWGANALGLGESMAKARSTDEIKQELSEKNHEENEIARNTNDTMVKNVEEISSRLALIQHTVSSYVAGIERNKPFIAPISSNRSTVESSSVKVNDINVRVNGNIKLASDSFNNTEMNSIINNKDFRDYIIRTVREAVKMQPSGKIQNGSVA